MDQRGKRAGFDLTRHWLLALNAAVAAFVGGALLAPMLAMSGWSAAASALYTAYSFTCHQWAFRSFFLFGQQPIYSRGQLGELGRDPFAFVGDSGVGWKMAFCERDLAIYIGLLAAGILFAQRRSIQPIGIAAYCLLALPMALDGFTQLFGWRESTWEQRVVTGLIFGVASAWLIYPHLDTALGGRPRVARQYPAPETAAPSCAPASNPVSPRG